jgi:spermidine/putrescine-binding protein
MAINVTRAREVLGKEAPLDSWDLLFNPATAAKLHKCGVSIMDQASDVFPHVLAYMGRDPNSRKPSDYRDAYEVLRKIRPYVDQFSSTYLNDMAGGDMCIAMAWSGDVGMIRRRAQQAGQKFEIRYVAPKGQSGLWFTFMGIPKDAANKENAYKWINHMLDVKVAAEITNTITYPTAVPQARQFVRPELSADSAVYPSAEEAKGFFMMAEIDPTIMHLITKLWLQFKAGS